jgi:hypothetical protein
MNDKITYYGNVENDVLKIHNRKAFVEEIKRLNGKPVTITIERRRSKRSGQQNKYYWSVVVSSIAFGLKDAGYVITSNDEVHEFLKDKFLPKRELVNEQTGEILQMPASTAGLNKMQMADYIAEIQQFSIEYLGVEIPAPGEQGELKL